MKTLKSTIITTLVILALAVMALIITVKPAYAATTNVTMTVGQTKTVKTTGKLTANNKKVIVVNKKIVAKKAGRTVIYVKKNKKTVNKININIKKSNKCQPGCHNYSLKRRTVIDKTGYTEIVSAKEFEEMTGLSCMGQETIEVRHPDESHEEVYLKCGKCHDIKTR